MMKILFVNACLREESRTEQLCRYYMEKQYDDEVVISECDLSKLCLKPITMDGLNQRNQDCAANDFSSAEYDAAKQFTTAEEIIIGAPYWDCSFPSMLKVYLEHICVNGITFGYDEHGGLLKFCHGKKLIYITTSGGYIPKLNSVCVHMKELCELFGIEDFRFYSAQGLDIYGNDVAQILDQTKTELTAPADCRTICSVGGLPEQNNCG